LGHSLTLAITGMPDKACQRSSCLDGAIHLCASMYARNKAFMRD
jgi:hypothetical protein